MAIEIPKINPKVNTIRTNAVKTFIIDNTGLSKLSLPEFGELPLVGDERVATSYLGTPIFSNLTFQGEGSYVNLEGDVIDFSELVLNTVLMTVSMSKNIVRTPLQGRNGTVKEYISNGDYIVNVQGALVTEQTLANLVGNQYPQDEMWKLINVLEAQSELTVTSNFLQLFNIDDVVITSFNIPQLKGSRTMQPFTITMEQDTPIELEIV